MRRLASLLLVLSLAGLAQGQMVMLGAHGGGSGVPASTPVFSPAAGTYTGAQTVSMSCPGSKSVFYRLDGQASATTIASTLYTAPITVSATTTITAICATLGAYQTNNQASTNGTACGVGPPPPPSTTTFGSRTCDNNGGVGTVTPSNLVWTIPGGTSASTMTITAPASTASSVQALFKYQYGGSVFPSAPTCFTCTTHVKDIKFTVIGSGLENQEFDSPRFIPTIGSTPGRDMQNGTQCQGSSGKIEVDSGNASGWTVTTASCSTWTSGTTHEVINEVDYDAAGSCPGGFGCADYKYIWADGVKTTLLGNYSNTQGFNSNSTGQAWGWQFQPDMLPTSGSAVTGGWTLISATVALGFGDESTVVSAAYTIQ